MKYRNRRSGSRGVWLASTLLASLACFFAVASYLSASRLEAFDARILMLLREPLDADDPLGPAWFESAVRDLTALGGTTVLTLFTLGAVAWLWARHRSAGAGLLLTSIVGGVLLSYALKWGFDRPRPEIVTHGQVVYTASFPSGHAMNAAIVYLNLGMMALWSQGHRVAGLLGLLMAVLLTLAVGGSRLYLGVHWPSDVIAGWLAGLAWVCLCWLMPRYGAALTGASSD